MRRTEGYLYLLTLTAPGDDEHSMPSGAVCECTPAGGIDLAKWNAGHSKRWNHFRTVLRREVSDQVEFFRGVEVQLRGALHDHAMVSSPYALDVKVLRRMAIRAGFGHSVDLAACAPGSRKAAYYVSKYCTKATDSRDLVAWWGEFIDQVDDVTGEITFGEGLIEARYRTWSMSRRWGSTMGQIRAEAAAYARGIRDKESAEGMFELLRQFGGQIERLSETPPAPS
jgi:hypothetical protein